MSLMFPTIYGLGIAGLGDDTKIGGTGMIMASAGAAVLTQIQGIVSDQSGSINLAFWVPAIAFMIIEFYVLTKPSPVNEAILQIRFIPQNEDMTN